MAFRSENTNLIAQIIYVVPHVTTDKIFTNKRSRWICFSILENTSNGPLLYSEEHAVQTDQFGRFSTNIGQGTSITGNFSTIDWLGGKRFLEVSVDLSGLGTNYTLTSVQEFLSVPYALVADRVRNNDDADADPTNESQSLTVVNDTVLSIS